MPRAVCSGLSAQGCLHRAACLGLFPQFAKFCVHEAVPVSVQPAYLVQDDRQQAQMEWVATHTSKGNSSLVRVCFDRQRGRGQMGAKSPLLWEEGQVESLLAGSPVVNMVKDRLKVRYCDVSLVLVHSCTATALMSQPQGTDSSRAKAPGQQP